MNGLDIPKQPETEDFPDTAGVSDTDSETYHSDIYDDDFKQADAVGADSVGVVGIQDKINKDEGTQDVPFPNESFVSKTQGIEPRELDDASEVKNLNPDTLTNNDKMSDTDKKSDTDTFTETDIATENPIVDEVNPNVGNSETFDLNSTETSTFICDHTKFLCDDGSDCLDGDAVCDGTQHCLDNSDEFNCTRPETTTAFSNSFHKSHKSHSEVTTELNPFEQENDAFATENPGEDIAPWIEKPSKRPSLADILSGSAHVSVPSSFHLSTSPSPVITKQFRFSSTKGPETRGKAFDSSPKPHRNSFSSFGPFPFTSKPKAKEEEENNSKTSPRLSLAALLSSTSMATSKPQLQSQNPFDYPDETESPFDEGAAESVDYPTFTATKSLSDLLSSSLPSFATSSARREHKECAELRCLDGTCLSLTQLNDGVKDCPDGSDEQKLNNFSLK